MKRYLNLHSLTTHAAVLLVRDADGRPKEIPYGDATRSMLPSQNFGRARREYMIEQASLGQGPLAGYAFGRRTREWGRQTAQRLHSHHDWDQEQAATMSRAVLSRLGLHFGTKGSTADLTKVLIFAPEHAHHDLAQIINEHREELTPWLAQYLAALADDTPDAEAGETAPAAKRGKKEKKPAPQLPGKTKSRLLTALAPADAIDIALWGRFLAEIADSPNVDGALQTVAAITVTKAAGTEDFYSAADDMKLTRQRSAPPAALSALAALDQASPFPTEDGGAGMTGYQHLISGCFYAHSVLDRHQLRTNLRRAGMDAEAAETAAQAAERAYIEAFTLAVPKAKKTSTAAPGTLPKLVLAFEADRQYNYISAFDEAIDETDGNGPAALQATHRLLDHHALIRRKFRLEAGRILTYDLAITRLLQQRTPDALTEVDHPTDLYSSTDLAQAPA